MEAEEASFSTEMDAISFGFKRSMSPSIPSIRTSGDALPLIELTPRILMVAEAPG